VLPAGAEPLLPPPAALVPVDVAVLVCAPLTPTADPLPLLELAVPALLTDVLLPVFDVDPLVAPLAAPPVDVPPPALLLTLVLLELPLEETLPLPPDALEDVVVVAVWLPVAVVSASAVPPARRLTIALAVPAWPRIRTERRSRLVSRSCSSEGLESFLDRGTASLLLDVGLG
jgi:hypothetical protein